MTDAPTEILAFREADVPRELRVQVLALQDQAWPPTEPAAADAEPELVHDPALHPLSMLLVRDGRVLSALDILSKSIVHDGQRYSASGLSTVVTDQAEQGKGYGLRLTVAGRERIEESGADLGIFTCDTPLQHFYERAGWTQLPGTVLIGGTPDDPFPSDLFDKVTMARLFSPRAQRNASHFTRRRIELYPGQIDKLW